MSEEVAAAAADLATVARLTAERDAAEKLVGDMRESYVQMYKQRDAALARVERLRAALEQVQNMFTIKGARVIALDALVADQPPPPPTE